MKNISFQVLAKLGRRPIYFSCFKDEATVYPNVPGLLRLIMMWNIDILIIIWVCASVLHIPRVPGGKAANWVIRLYRGVTGLFIEGIGGH